MKISEIILQQGINRRFRGPRKPRLKQKGFHKRMKGLLDSENVTEAAKNTHLDHAEELVFMHGTKGIQRVVGTFAELLKSLQGGSGEHAVTTKWDGSPAIFCGKDPADGQFFVGTKGVFAKTPKLNKSPQDIEQNHGDTVKNGEPVSKEGLRNKLNASLMHLKDLGIEGVLQGDLLFTKGDLKTVNINGEKHIAFKPNTITYTVPADSETAREMMAAEIGIVFHTSYEGDALADMSAKFGFDASSLKKTPKVWFTDARIKNVSGQVQLDKKEAAIIAKAIKDLSTMQVDANVFNQINDKIGGIDLVQALKAHANAPIRDGRALENDPKKFVVDFLRRLEAKFDDDVSKLKTGAEGPAGQKKLAAKGDIANFIKSNEQSIAVMYAAYLKVEAVKMMFQRKMRDIKAIDSFIQQPDGSFKVTDPEGFVVVDQGGNAMKIVDRLEFSAANFAPRD
jgi:hypothetical protein